MKLPTERERREIASVASGIGFRLELGYGPCDSEDAMQESQRACHDAGQRWTIMMVIPLHTECSEWEQMGERRCRAS